jgi:hypothetical protein
MNASEITVLQQKILSAVTVRCGSISLVPVLCDLLHLSKSAVYDRINGTKSLSFPELIVLLDTFSISLEEMMAVKPERISFLTNSILTPVKNGQTYLKTLQENVTAFAQTDGLRVWFSSPSLPFFHHMHFRELALFKLFAYARINWQLSYTENLVFHPDTFPEKFLYEQYMQPIIALYSQLPTTEFCSDDLYYHTLRQIQYFSDSGQITDTTVISVLMEQLANLCDHQQEMAKQGKKWVHGSKKQPETAQCGKLDLYYNEISPTTISLLLESPSAKGVFTVLDDPNFMYSDNPYLYEYTLAWMHKLRVKCVRISEDAERERRIYFNRIREQIKGGR